MLNAAQITNFDIKDAIPDFESYGHPYVQLNNNYLKNTITKFGYCCEPKGIGLPIFLEINGLRETFIIGKTGMFEIQEEFQKNINDESFEQENIKINIPIIQVPQDIQFKLDFVYTTN